MNECMVKSMGHMLPWLRKGIPEIDMPPLEPMYIDIIILGNEAGFNGSYQNVTINGVSFYEVIDSHVDMTNRKINLDLVFPKIKTSGFASFEAKLIVLFKGEGYNEITAGKILYCSIVIIHPKDKKLFVLLPKIAKFLLNIHVLVIFSDDVSCKMQISWKLLEKKRATRFYFDGMKTKLDMDGFTVRYNVTGGFNDLSILPAFEEVLKQIQGEILDLLVPHIEKAISTVVLESANKIVGHFTYDELFPDRE